MRRYYSKYHSKKSGVGVVAGYLYRGLFCMRRYYSKYQSKKSGVGVVAGYLYMGALLYEEVL